MNEMTRDDFSKELSNDPLVIVPWGACEAHGPHLPLSADSIQPEYVAKEISKRIDDVIIAPTVNYALHSSTKNMSGTLSLTFDTVRSIAHDITMSLYRQGIRRIMIIAGHAGSGHLTAISEGCKRTVGETDAKIVFFSDWYVSENCPSLQEIEHDGHAGCAETSRIMAIRPDLVRNTEIETGNFIQTYLIFKNGSRCFPQGYEGNVSKATPELGNVINDYIVEEVIRMINDDL